MLKKMMLAGLMTATVLGGIAPAYAQGREDGWRGRGDERAARQDGDGPRGRDATREQRGDDSRRDQAGQRWQQRQVDRGQIQTEQPRPDRQWRAGEARGDAARDASRNETRIRQQAETQRPQWRDDRRSGDRPDWRDNRQTQRPEWRDNRRDDRLSSGNHWRGSLANPRRFDDRTRWNGQRRWDNGWRQDRRYDWYSYRSRYGDRYRAGRYYAPRGWDYGYTRFSVGIFLNSLLFSNSYWIDDPYSYRLPPAYGTLRWVRYYDDALLVDIRDGYVVDVIHDFFW
ncbi:RcnB family protein [Sphingobium tyrosinilyticum]|uniref:RcnB family protein n=1 Tax=Sphingobium tyrosinilyticum TaxID=2715436 RepID=A0ABV9F0U1_9SPHN